MYFYDALHRGRIRHHLRITVATPAIYPRAPGNVILRCFTSWSYPASRGRCITFPRPFDLQVSRCRITIKPPTVISGGWKLLTILFAHFWQLLVFHVFFLFTSPIYTKITTFSLFGISVRSTSVTFKYRSQKSTAHTRTRYHITWSFIDVEHRKKISITSRTRSPLL